MDINGSWDLITENVKFSVVENMDNCRANDDDDDDERI
jgi:hypothetical protein